MLSFSPEEVAQVLSFEELEAIVEQLQNIANAVHRRLRASASPLKSSENRIGKAKHEQYMACTQALRRYLTTVCVEPLPSNQQGLSPGIRAEFKLLHQNTTPIQGFCPFTELELEITSVQHFNGSEKFISARASIEGQWSLLWDLALSPSNEPCSSISLRDDVSSINDTAVTFLHLRASPLSFTENIFLLALGTILVDSVFKCLGEDILDGGFEEVLASLIDSKRSLHYTETPLDAPTTRTKRSGFEMDEDLSQLSTPTRRVNPPLLFESSGSSHS